MRVTLIQINKWRSKHNLPHFQCKGKKGRYGAKLLHFVNIYIESNILKFQCDWYQLSRVFIHQSTLILQSWILCIGCKHKTGLFFALCFKGIERFCQITVRREGRTCTRPRGRRVVPDPREACGCPPVKESSVPLWEATLLSWSTSRMWVISLLFYR